MRSYFNRFVSPYCWMIAIGWVIAFSTPAPAQDPKPRTTLGDGTKWLKSPDSLACSPDGQSLAIAAAGRVHTYDVTKKTLTAEWEPYQKDSTPQLVVAFSPDGKTLVTGAFHETAKKGGAHRVCGMSPRASNFASSMAPPFAEAWPSMPAASISQRPG